MALSKREHRNTLSQFRVIHLEVHDNKFYIIFHFYQHLFLFLMVLSLLLIYKQFFEHSLRPR